MRWVIARLRQRLRRTPRATVEPVVPPQAGGPDQTTEPATPPAPPSPSATALATSATALATSVTAPLAAPAAPATGTASAAPGVASAGPATGVEPATGVPHQRAIVLSGPPPQRGRHLVYAPELDGRADPGEIVWTWVAYEEDPSRGKDRPVLVVGRDGNALLGLMLSSNRDRDGQRHWYALGPGPWDRQRRPSWVRLDRVLLVPEDGIRREGCVLDRERFEAVAAVLRRSYAWS